MSVKYVVIATYFGVRNNIATKRNLTIHEARRWQVYYKLETDIRRVEMHKQ